MAAESSSATAGTLERVASFFGTFTSWGLIVHLTYVGLLILGKNHPEFETLAYQWVFPISHWLAWAIFIGSHVLVYYYPQTMHAPEIEGLENIGAFTILVGHEIQHVLPVVALYVFPVLRPQEQFYEVTAFWTASAVAVLLGLSYVGWRGGRNPYGASTRHFRHMLTGGFVAGMMANACIYFLN